MTRSITELQNSGVTVRGDEAVAIAQQLIAASRASGAADEAAPPFGPPSADNVFLNENGSVVCRGCATTLAVSEVGILLDGLLPDGSPRVPGGLRYTIARALLNVDVRPFESLDALARDLARHEHGDRAAMVRGLLHRALRPGSGQALRPDSGLAVRLDSVQPLRPWAAVANGDRRRASQASSSDLRRALREAEVRLFETRSLLPKREVIDVQPAPPAVAPPDPGTVQLPRERTLTAVAACLAAGFALVGTGELMQSRRVPNTALAPIQPPATMIVQAAAAPVAVERGLIAADRGVVAVRASAPAVRRRPAGAQPVVAVKHVKRARPAAQIRQDRGVLDRLKLGWLRRAFIVKSDL